MSNKKVKLNKPIDIVNRDKFLEEGEEFIKSETKRAIKNLNTRLKRLEKTGLYKFNPNYYRLKNFIKDTFGGTETFKYSQMSSAPIKERATYLAKLNRFLNYKTTITETRAIKEKIRSDLERSIGANISDERLDTIGSLMGDIWRRKGPEGDMLREALGSDEVRQFVIEHEDMTADDVEKFFDAAKDILENNRLTDQEVKDEIMDITLVKGYNAKKVGDIYIDKETMHPIDAQTGELFTDVYFDATTEKLVDLDNEVVNEDESMEEYLLRIYGYSAL